MRRIASSQQSFISISCTKGKKQNKTKQMNDLGMSLPGVMPDVRKSIRSQSLPKRNQCCSNGLLRRGYFWRMFCLLP
jgi:hypothetical protein